MVKLSECEPVGHGFKPICVVKPNFDQVFSRVKQGYTLGYLQNSEISAEVFGAFRLTKGVNSKIDFSLILG